MSDYHTAKYVLEGMTFGEYWNLVGCHCAAVKVKGYKDILFPFVEEGCVKLWQLGSVSKGPVPGPTILLSEKIKISGNKIETKDDLGKPINIEFFELVAAKSPVDIA